MTYVLIVPAWLIMLALVVGLCTAARVGDRPMAQDPAASDGGAVTPGSQVDEPTPLSRPGGVRPVTATRGRVPAGNVAA
jgi:hypothetical protein